MIRLVRLRGVATGARKKKVGPGEDILGKGRFGQNVFDVQVRKNWRVAIRAVLADSTDQGSSSVPPIAASTIEFADEFAVLFFLGVVTELQCFLPSQMGPICYPIVDRLSQLLDEMFFFFVLHRACWTGSCPW